MYNVPCQRSGESGVSLPSSYLLHSTPPHGGHACGCRVWGHPGCSHGSHVSGYQAGLCGLGHPCLEGARSWGVGAPGGRLSPSAPPPTGHERKRREEPCEPESQDLHGAPATSPCRSSSLSCVPVCVLERASERARDSEPSRPSTEIRAPPKQETEVFLPPLPGQSSLFLPAASHPRQILKSRRQN